MLQRGGALHTMIQEPRKDLAAESGAVISAFFARNDSIIYASVTSYQITPAKTTSAVGSADERRLNWRHLLLSILALNFSQRVSIFKSRLYL